MFSKSKSPPVRASGDAANPDTARPLSNGSPATNGRVLAPPVASAHRPPASAHGSVASERDERRHQRAIIRERSARGERSARQRGAKATPKRDDAEAGGATAGERLNQAKAQLAEPSRRGRLALGETVSLGLLGIVAVGVAAGAILGAFGIAGWIVGLVVAILTLGLSAALRHSWRGNRPALALRNRPTLG
jgi:hypothetical protein